MIRGIAGHEWAVASPRSPDNSSPVYPHRPIRPLPKRRLRSRLSVEEAEGIIFPTLPPSLFGSPRDMLDRADTSVYRPSPIPLQDDEDHEHICECGGNHDLESDEEEEVKPSSNARYAWQERKYQRESVEPAAYRINAAYRIKSPQPLSATSSADGYESFENTNNKKKRKIPVPGTFAELSSLDSMGTDVASQIEGCSPGERAYQSYHTNSSYSSVTGVGISGAGRGRHGRASRFANERRPIATSTSRLTSGLSGKFYPEAASRTSIRFDYGLRRSLTYPLDHAEQQGIISAAMASAAANGQSSVMEGQEHVSLLQRQSPDSTAVKDFTFEYPSDSANKMGNSARVLPPKGAGRLQPSAAQVTQTSVTRNDGQYPVPRSDDQYASNRAAAPPPKPRRPGNVLRGAAQQRRQQQTYSNRSNPPRREDMYICEFCEYESIYGRPPAALIRQYEIKDWRERKAKELNRRRLEKMKARGRKNRKGGRNNFQNSAATPTDINQQPYDDRYDPPDDDDSQGEEDFFEEGDNDDVPSLPATETVANGRHHRNQGLDSRYKDYGYSSQDPRPPLEPPLQTTAVRH